MRPSLSVTVSFDGLPSTTWWLVRIRPFASKITPLPIAVPWPVWPVVGSVAVTPSAVMVTTAGLTALTTSTSEPPWPVAGCDVGACWPDGAWADGAAWPVPLPALAAGAWVGVVTAAVLAFAPPSVALIAR